MFFMSMAPRPQTTPSRTSPEKGCTRQSAGSAGTTSRWPWTSRASAAGSLPSMRATTFVRPLLRSSSVGSSPASASRSATYSAAGRSWHVPSPALLVSIRIRSEVKRTTSSSAC